MLKLNGQITIKRLDQNGLLKDELTIENIVTKYTFSLAIVTGQSPFSNARRIALSTSEKTTTIDTFSNQEPNFNIQNMNNIIAVGYWSGDNAVSYPNVNGYQFFSSPNRCRYHFRFPFTGSIRSFSTIALVNNNTGNNGLLGVTYQCLAYTTLDQAFVQQPNEIIDIVYDFTVNWATPGQEAFKALWERYLFNQGIMPQFDHAVPVSSFKPSAFTQTNSAIIRPIATRITPTLTTNANLFKRNYTGVLNQNLLKGLFYSGLYFGGQDHVYSSSIDINNKLGPIQNCFSHASTSNTLYYDSTNLATSSYKPIISGTDTTGFPSILSILVIGGGYRFIKKTFFGQLENTVLGATQPIYFPSYSYHSTLAEPVNYFAHTKYDSTNYLLNYQNRPALLFYNVKTKTINKTVTLLSGATNFYINDINVTSDLRYIYVASPTHGLFEIDTQNSDTVTRLSTSDTYFVCVTPNNNWVISHPMDGLGFVRFAPGDWTNRIRTLSSVTEVTNSTVMGRFRNDLTGIVNTYPAQVTNARNPFIPANVTIETLINASTITNNPKLYYINLSSNTSQLFSSTFTFNPASATLPSGVINQSWLSGASTTASQNYNGGNWPPLGWNTFKVLNLSANLLWHNFLGCQGKLYLEPNSQLILFYVPYNTSGNYPFEILFLHRPGDTTDGTPVYVGDQVTGGTSVLITNTETLPSEYTTDKPTGTGTFFGGGPRTICKFDFSTIFSNTFTGRDQTVRRGHSIVKLLNNDITATNNIASSIQDGGNPSSVAFSHYKCNSLAILPATWNEFDANNRVMIGISFDGSIYLAGHFSIFDATGKTLAHLNEFYGWTGTEWQKGFNGSKSLHTGTEALVDGLSLAWADLSNNNPVGLVNGQWYTQVVGDGFLVDGYHPTNLNPTFAYYFRDKIAFNLNQTISDVNLRVDYSDSDFYRLDDHDLNVHNLYINGSLAQLQLTANPNPGVITLNPTIGSLEFNSIDLGKTLTGTLVYTKILHSTELNNPSIYGTLKDSQTLSLIPNLRLSIPQLGYTQVSITGTFFIPLNSGNTTLSLTIHDENGVYQEQTQQIVIGLEAEEVNLLFNLKPLQTFPSEVKSIAHCDSAIYSSITKVTNNRDSIRGAGTFTQSYGQRLNGTFANSFLGKYCWASPNAANALLTVNTGAMTLPVSGDNWTVEFDFAVKYVVTGTDITLLVLGSTLNLIGRPTSNTEMRFVLTGTNTVLVPVNPGLKIVSGVWYKIAVVRTNGILYLFVNGFLYYSYTPSNSTFHTFSLPAAFGLMYQNNGSNDRNNLYIRETRITYQALYTASYTPVHERFLDADRSTLVQLSGNVGQEGILVEVGNGPSGGINATSDSSGNYLIKNIVPNANYQVTVYDPLFNFQTQVINQSILVDTVLNVTLIANLVTVDPNWANVICHLPFNKGEYNSDYFLETKGNYNHGSLFASYIPHYNDYQTYPAKLGKQGLFNNWPLQLTGVTGIVANAAFTLDFWVYIANCSNDGAKGILGVGTTNYSFIGFRDTEIFAYGTGLNSVRLGEVKLDRWTHVAVIYLGSNLYKLFLNGLQIGTTFSMGTSYTSATTVFCMIFNPTQNIAANKFSDGIADLRYTAGIRYAAEFTPPPFYSPLLTYFQKGTLTLTLNVAQTNVKILNANNQIVHEQNCNTGTIIDLPIGTYTVVSQKEEYNSVVISSVVILNAQNTDLTITLTATAQTKIDSEYLKTTYYFNGIVAQTINNQTSFAAGRNLFFNYGNKSLALNRSYLTISDSANVNTSSGDFTLEFILNYSKNISSTNGVYDIWNEKGIKISLVGDTIIFPAIGIFNAPKWLESGRFYHVAITRVGNTFKCFIDGLELWTTTFSGSITRSGTVLSLNGDMTTTHLTGSFEFKEVKLTKTLGRYSTTFPKLTYLPIQSAAGYTVSGLVKDAQNNGLPNIKVWIPNIGQTITDSSGQFTIPNVLPGNYSLIMNSKENGLLSKNRIILITVGNANLSVPDTTISLQSSNDNFSGYVSLYHSFNGTNNQIIFPEEKFGYQITRVGNPRLSTTRSRSGATSLYLDGSSSINFPVDLALSNGDWTLEFWVWKEANTVVGSQTLAEYGLFSNGFELSSGDTAAYINNTLFYCPTVEAGKWVHVAMVRYSTQFMVFHDGIRVLNGAISIALTVPGNTARLTIGNSNSGGNDWFTGYIDTFRFTTGIARYINLVETPTL